MTTIAIPKNLAKKGDLVIISREEYEGLKSVGKKTITELDRDLGAAILEYRSGKSYGPFATAEAGIRFLRRHRVRPRSKK